MIRPHLALPLLAATAAAPLYAAAPEHMELLVTEAEAEGNFGTLGAYTYDPQQNLFWTVLFGSGAGVRQINPGFGSAQVVFPSDLLRFLLSTDVAGGVTDASRSAGNLAGAVLLNPAPITIDYGGELDQNGNAIGEITYQPGQLAYIINMGGEVEDPITEEVFNATTKRLFRYDLRPVGFSQPSGVGAPDRNNAQDGIGNVVGAYNRVDWNDALAPLVSEQDLLDAADAEAGGSGSNFGRQFAWSSDGQSIYAVDSGTDTGGVFKIDPVSGAATQIYREAVASNVTAEPAVIHSSVRDFGSGTGDQIIFDGTSANGNDGGISYIVDDGTPGKKTSHVLLAGAEVKDFTQKSSSNVMSLAADDDGDIYFYNSSARGLFRYDAQGRLVAIVNQIQLLSFNQSADGSYADSGGMLRLQVFEDGSDKRLFYRSDNKQIVGITIGKTGDFTGDGQISAADTSFFIQQFKTTTLPTGGTQALLDYAAADLNGSGTLSSSGVLGGKAVDHRDLDALRQFVNLRDGDTDWNFTVDIADFQRLRSNFDPFATGKTFFDGNSNYAADGNVDIADFQALRSNFNPATPYEPEPTVGGVAVAAVTAVEPGEILLEVDVVTGEVRLVADGVEFESFQIVGSAESVLEENYLGIPGFTDVTGDAFVASLNLTDSLLLDGALDLGAIYNIGADLRDFVATFGVGVTTSDIGVVYVPEPASAAMLALAAATVLRRRKAS